MSPRSSRPRACLFPPTLHILFHLFILSASRYPDYPLFIPCRTLLSCNLNVEHLRHARSHQGGDALQAISYG
jgi:hypothetical protein